MERKEKVEKWVNTVRNDLKAWEDYQILLNYFSKSFESIKDSQLTISKESHLYIFRLKRFIKKKKLNPEIQLNRRARFAMIRIAIQVSRGYISSRVEEIHEEGCNNEGSRSSNTSPPQQMRRVCQPMEQGE